MAGRPSVVTKYPFQGEVKELSGFSDSDWAGCRRTAKSTSGGVIMRGGHCLKSWSSTQKNITLSSGEAELVAAVKMSTEVLAIIQMAQEWGMTLEGRVYVDSSAALGVVARKGCGKLRHIKIGTLWVQEKAEEGELVYKKVKGENNPADLMTKSLSQNVIDQHMERMGQKVTDGKAKIGLGVQR